MSNWFHNSMMFRCTGLQLMLFLRHCVCPFGTFSGHIFGESFNGLTWNMQNLFVPYDKDYENARIYQFKEFSIDITEINNDTIRNEPINRHSNSHTLCVTYDDGFCIGASYRDDNNIVHEIISDNKNWEEKEYDIYLYFNVRGYCPPYALIIMLAQYNHFDFDWYACSDMSPYGVTYQIRDRTLYGALVDDDEDEYYIDEEEQQRDPDDDSWLYEEVEKDTRRFVFIGSFDKWFDNYFPLTDIKCIPFSKATLKKVHKQFAKDDD